MFDDEHYAITNVKVSPRLLYGHHNPRILPQGGVLAGPGPTAPEGLDEPLVRTLRYIPPFFVPVGGNLTEWIRVRGSVGASHAAQHCSRSSNRFEICLA